MASTYSSLKIELIGTGDQAGTWGTTTNANLGTAIEEAITGSANVTFASANVALALADTNAAQTARNLRLNLTGTITNVQYLFVPAIEKQYLIRNGLSNSVIIANGTNAGATGTTFTLPAGRSTIVFNDGTSINDVITFTSSLSNVTIDGGTANAVTLTNSSAVNATFTNYTETTFTGNSSNATTINLSNGTVQIITLTANATITMPTATAGKSFILMLKTGTGNYSVTWSTVKWPSNTAPTITGTASRQDIYSFFADGTNWFGIIASQNYTV
jgi:hypothetical protein